MKSSYKILQIVDSLEIGGSERMSVNIYNSLTSNNIENCLVVTRKSGPLFSFISENKNVFFLNKKGVYDCHAFFNLIKKIKKYNPSVIHSHQTSIYWSFIIKLMFPKITLIWHDHWGNSDLLKNSDRKIVKYFSFLIDGVICVNEKIKKWNIRNLKLNMEFITYIPNFPLFKNIERKKTNIPTIVCVANIRSQKDHPNLLKACSILKEQEVNYKILLVGSLEDLYWVKKIKNLINEYNLNKNVVLLGPVTDICEVLSIADVGVLSSVSEGLPVSLLEYGLAGLPVVCTDVGQCREVLGYGKFGWLIPSRSPLELAEALKESLNDSRQAELKSLGLKKHIEENYSSNKFFKSYFEFVNIIKKENV
ncbi:MAG: glycosyltransferase [Flaviramulus sp.]|nr:glycosyltransferase [Flaviramulus sp.]NNC50922.1 glycosyltransferase [Flaviramulus sp.]